MTKRKCEITLVPTNFITKMGKKKGGRNGKKQALTFNHNPNPREG